MLNKNKIFKLFILLVLFAASQSCKQRQDYDIWVGTDVHNRTYIEFWFASNTVIMYDYELGYYRTSYTFKDNKLIFNDSYLKSDTLSLKLHANNRIEILSMDSIFLTCLVAKFPYLIDPFQIDLNKDESIDKYLDPFMTEVFKRRDFYFDYLNQDFFLTNY